MDKHIIKYYSFNRINQPFEAPCRGSKVIKLPSVCYYKEYDYGKVVISSKHWSFMIEAGQDFNKEIITRFDVEKYYEKEQQ